MTYKPGAGLIHHSDQGVQYASRDYQKFLLEYHVVPSMSRKDIPYDNACTESFFGTIKLEMIYYEHYAARAQAQAAIFEYIEIPYNRQRHTGGIPKAFLSATGGIARYSAISFDFSRLLYSFVSE